MQDSENTRSCKRRKSKLINGLKCIECDNYLHINCAKLTNNVKIIDETTVKCCVGIKNKSEEDSDYEALFGTVHSNGRIDIGLVKLILKQKDCILDELK